MHLCKKPLRLTRIHKHTHDYTVLVPLLLLLACVLSLWCPGEAPFWSSAHEHPQHNGALLTLLHINTSDPCSPSRLCNPQGSTSGACPRRRRIRERLPHQLSLKGQVQLPLLHWEEGNDQCSLQSLSVYTWKEGARDMHGIDVHRGGDSRAQHSADTALKEKWVHMCSPRRCFTLLSKNKAKINQSKHSSFHRVAEKQPSCKNNKSCTVHSSFSLL